MNINNFFDAWLVAVAHHIFFVDSTFDSVAKFIVVYDFFFFSAASYIKYNGKFFD